MTPASDDAPIDARLERLLEVERELEARVRQAEDTASAQVEAARAVAQRAERERGGNLEAAAQSEEAADLERHAVQLRGIAEESAALQRRLSTISESLVDGLARRAVARVLAREGVGRL